MDAENTRRNTMKDLTLNNLLGSDKIYSPALHYIEYPPPSQWYSNKRCSEYLKKCNGRPEKLPNADEMNCHVERVIVVRRIECELDDKVCGT